MVSRARRNLFQDSAGPAVTLTDFVFAVAILVFVWVFFLPGRGRTPRPGATGSAQSGQPALMVTPGCVESFAELSETLIESEPGQRLPACALIRSSLLIGPDRRGQVPTALSIV